MLHLTLIKNANILLYSQTPPLYDHCPNANNQQSHSYTEKYVRSSCTLIVIDMIKTCQLIQTQLTLTQLTTETQVWPSSALACFQI